MLDLFRSKAPAMEQAPPITERKKTTGSIRALKVGYGFIAGDDGVDYFFHWSSMLPTTKNFRNLVVQERVSFDYVESDRGRRAICIQVI